MTTRLRGRILLALTIGGAVIATTACARSPRIDGGIVGTGNRIECDAPAAKESRPPECR